MKTAAHDAPARGDNDHAGDRPGPLRRGRGRAAAGGDRTAGDRRRRGAASCARSRRRPGRLASHDRPALPGPPRGLRGPRPQDARPWPRGRGPRRGDRQGRDDVPGRRRGVRHRRGRLRRIRLRPAGQACAPAGEPHRRSGGRGARLSPDRPAGCPRPRARARRAEGPGHRRIGRRRDVRRADRQGLRCRSHRRVQHDEDGPGPVRRRGPRDRLHARPASPTENSATT